MFNINNLIMKKILLLLLLISATVGANAQWKIGFAKIDCEAGKKGEEVWYYQKNKEIEYICMPDKGWNVCGTLPASYVEFSGYYLGMVTDPVDNYVNIRKGPGTNYSIVDRIDVGDYVTFKYSNNNWLQVYELDKVAQNKSWEIMGYMHTNYYKLIFKGYIYKNRVIDVFDWGK